MNFSIPLSGPRFWCSTGLFTGNVPPLFLAQPCRGQEKPVFRLCFTQSKQCCPCHTHLRFFLDNLVLSLDSSDHKLKQAYPGRSTIFLPSHSQLYPFKVQCIVTSYIQPLDNLQLLPTPLSYFSRHTPTSSTI